MATTNPFDLLGDDDNDDPSQLLAAQQQKIAPKKAAAAQPAKSAKLPSKPPPPAQAGEIFQSFSYLSKSIPTYLSDLKVLKLHWILIRMNLRDPTF